MAMSEFEKAQLALMQQQVEATNANTAALAALRHPPTPAELAERQAAEFESVTAHRNIRSTQPMHETAFVCQLSVEGTSIEVNGRVEFQFMRSTRGSEGKGPGGWYLIQVIADDMGDEAGPLHALFLAPFNQKHADLIREAETSPTHSEALKAMHTKEWRKFCAWQGRRHLHNLLLGKHLDKVGKIAKLETRPPAIGSAEATPATPAAPVAPPIGDDGKPVRFDEPAGSRRLESMVAG